MYVTTSTRSTFKIADRPFAKYLFDCECLRYKNRVLASGFSSANKEVTNTFIYILPCTQILKPLRLLKILNNYKTLECTFLRDRSVTNVENVHGVEIKRKTREPGTNFHKNSICFKLKGTHFHLTY